jgi:predicted nucleic acid-binding Zn ribbon protein
VPIYVLKCVGCGETFEALCRKIGDTSGTSCPNGCGAQLQRKPAPTSFRLQGHGWASDGYKGAAEKKADS